MIQKKLQGACPIIEIFPQIRAFFKISTGIHLVFRVLFKKNNKELGKKSILGQTPRLFSLWQDG